MILVFEFFDTRLFWDGNVWLYDNGQFPYVYFSEEQIPGLWDRAIRQLYLVLDYYKKRNFSLANLSSLEGKLQRHLKMNLEKPLVFKVVER